MSFARKLKRKTQNKRKTRCCGQQMTHKAGYGYVCEKCGKDIESNLDKPSVYSGMCGHTQVQSDIKRLRRELLELSNMIGCQYGR